MEYVRDLLIRAINDLNENLDQDCQYEYSEDMIFMGKDSAIDSMDRVCLIEFIESAIEEDKGISLELLNDTRFADGRSFTLLELESYISEKLNENKKL